MRAAGRRAAALIALVLGAGPAATAPAPAAVTSARPAAAPAIAAVDAPRYLLLMDTSGSMAEADPSGRVKVEGAKAAANNALDGMTATALVALRTYPDQSNDCGPGNKRYDFAPPADPGLRQAISGLPTHGQTPTAPALQAAADDLLQAGLTDGSTIILVSDGLSNCGGDPCEVARGIAGRGLAIVNTVGFQISAEGQRELDCIAQATGGQSFHADDAEALRQAIEDAATPRLSVTLGTPEPNAIVAPGSIVVVTATVANTSRQPADRVQTLLRFLRDDASDIDPGVPGPLRSLGNLGPGQSRTLTWQYRAGADMANRRSRFVVTAVGANASPARTTRSITYSGAVDLASAGPLLGERGSRVVIVGDSFSSGEGAGGYLPGTDQPFVNRCHRSLGTYAMTLDYETPPLVLACSGATTADILGDHRQWNEDSQVDRLRSLKVAPDLILMTLGGNDAGFGDIVSYCFHVQHCHDTASLNPELDGRCLNAYLDAGAFDALVKQVGVRVADVRGIPTIPGCPSFVAPYRAMAIALMERIGTDLHRAYGLIDSALNGPTNRARRGGRIAPIVVLAYPQLVPRQTENRGFCSWGLAEDELRFGEDFTRRLNARIGATVDEARRGGLPIFFAADVADALRPGHTLCDADPHANRLSPTNFVGHYKVPNPEMMHPNAAGYRDMTAALVRWTNRPEVLNPEIRRDVFELPVGPATPPPLGTSTVPLAPGPSDVAASLLQGQAVTVQGGGFAPGGAVTITVQSAPRHLARVDADDAGRVAAVVAMPEDLAPGPHTVVARGFGPAGEPRALYAVVDIRPPFPVVPVVLLGLAAGLVVGGVAVHWHRGRRRRQAGQPGRR